EQAIDEEWEEKRPELDSVFSPTIPPLERLRRYCEMGLRMQTEMRAKYGRVLGCPLCSVGSEVSTQEDRLQKKIERILDYKRKYLESTIRDAHAAGVIHAPDAAAKARTLFAYYQGLLTEARIRDDLEILRESVRGTYELLGVKEPEAVAG